MNALLALLLKDRISAFTYVDRLAGLVRAVSREQAGGETITIPVAIGVDDPLACGDSLVLDLVPDERYACMVYFEDKGCRTVQTRTRGTSFECRMRMVCWVNTARFNGDPYAGDRILQQFVGAIPSSVYNDGPFIGVRHSIEAVPERGKGLFSLYTYPSEARQYLLYPFDAFAIDILTVLRIKPGCEDQVNTTNAECWTPPANRRRRFPSEFTCEELNAPITGLTDQQKEECLDCSGGGGPCDLCEEVNAATATDVIGCVPGGNVPEYLQVVVGRAESTPQAIVDALDGAGKTEAVKDIICDPCPDCDPNLDLRLNGGRVFRNVPLDCGVNDYDIIVTRQNGDPIGSWDAVDERIEIAPGTVQLQDSAGNPIGSPVNVQPESTGNVITAPDGTVNVRNSALTILIAQAVRSGATVNADVADSTIKRPDGTTFGLPATQAFDIRTLRSGIVYQFGGVLWSGQKSSFRTGDEGDLWATGWYNYNRPVYPLAYARLGADRVTLAENNIHGNTNRFTDRSGGQTYANNIVQDHLTGIEWYRVLQGVATWNDAIDGAVALNIGGNTDWRLPPSKVIDSIANDQASVGGNALNYAPFSIANTNYWTSSTYMVTTANAFRMSAHQFSAQAKTNVNQWIACRKFL